jgi:hypothetical protein
MAYNDFDFGVNSNTTAQTDTKTILKADGTNIALPDASYVKDAAITRDGMDLILSTDKGDIQIDGYFAAATPPTLNAPDGAALTPKLVKSFVTSAPEYADAGTMVDESPVGAVQEISGSATVTRLDGSTEPVTIGTEIYNGDILETSADGAVNIGFIDETSFAVSENARLAIDEYVYDPATESGVTDFSVLKGMFVYTSGLIGRDDPDDVSIETPAGSIGIRGTIIAGDVNSGEITVVEGAIVLRDFSGNEVTLANQFETAKFNSAGQGIEPMGQLNAADVATKFTSVSGVSPTLFSSINDAAAEQDNAAGERGADNGAEDGAEAAQDGENGENTENGENADQATDAENGESAENAENAENGEAAQNEDGGESKADGAEAKGDQPAEAGEGKPGANGPDGAEKAGKGADAGADNTTTDGAKAQGPDGADKGPRPVADHADGIKQPGLDAQKAHQITKAQTFEARVEAAKTADAIMAHNNVASKTIANRIADLINKFTDFSLMTNTSRTDLPETNSIQSNSTTENTTHPEFDEDKGGFPTSSNFFKLVEGDTSWHVNFDQLFRDPDGHDSALTYHLESDLSHLVGTVLNSFDASTDFDSASGRLSLDFKSDFADLSNGEEAFNIRVKVTDTDGNSTTKTFDFHAYEADAVATTSLDTSDNSSTVFYVNSTSSILDGYENGAQISVKDGSGSLLIRNLDNATLDIGEGGKTVTINPNADNNIIIGSNNAAQSDTFIVKGDTNNDIYAMDGQDTIKLELSDTLITSLTSGTHTMNGGWNSHSEAQSIQHNETPTAGHMGDTLQLFNGGSTEYSLDFGHVTNNIRNFENIELSGAGGNSDIDITLGIDDIFAMTDDHNIMTISSDENGDHDVDLNGNFTQGNDEIINGETYHSYSGTHNGATVTLLIEDGVDVTTAA